MEDEAAPAGRAPLAGQPPAPLSDDPRVEAGRLELARAIAMVASGWAVSVVLCGLGSPEALVAALAASAAAAGVTLRTEHAIPGGTDIVVRRSRA